MNFYQHHIGDYSKDTAHLSMLEDAAYRRMLDVYYATEKPLPKPQQSIYRLVRARSKSETLAVDVVLGEFFTEGEKGWHNKRADEEIAKAHAKSDKARESAAQRWQSDGNASASANAMRTQSEGNAPNNQEPRTKNQKKPTTAGKPAEPDGFPEFRSIYPRRAGNNPLGRALKAYKARLAEGHAAAEFIEGARRYADFIRSVGKEGTEFVLQASTFLGPDKPFTQEWAKPNGAGGMDVERIVRELEEEERNRAAN